MEIYRRGSVWRGELYLYSHFIVVFLILLMVVEGVVF